MNYLLEFLTDPYLQDIADYFASQHPELLLPELTNVSQQVLAQGESLVMGGDAARQIPACRSCHGPALTGMEPGIPGLVGLRAPYIAAQLTRWRVGSRHAAEPDCMKRIVSRLSEADIAAVSAWLARQDPPADASPESPNLVRMPYACGSQQ